MGTECEKRTSDRSPVITFKKRRLFEVYFSSMEAPLVLYSCIFYRCLPSTWRPREAWNDSPNSRSVVFQFVSRHRRVTQKAASAPRTVVLKRTKPEFLKAYPENVQIYRYNLNIYTDIILNCWLMRGITTRTWQITDFLESNCNKMSFVYRNILLGHINNL